MKDIARGLSLVKATPRLSPLEDYIPDTATLANSESPGEPIPKRGALTLSRAIIEKPDHVLQHIPERDTEIEVRPE